MTLSLDADRFVKTIQMATITTAMKLCYLDDLVRKVASVYFEKQCADMIFAMHYVRRDSMCRVALYGEF
ncbi:hypothetical protein GBA52_025021 [Prunus armeniaca]|nr:hypothetical protein GBA52_025021 [Prunus armeniaca]